jgi:hypothetical protein
MRRAILLTSFLSAACNPNLPHYSDDDATIDANDGSDALLDGPPGTYHIGGAVGGMWTGGTVALRLQATGIDDLKSVTSNGNFNFDEVLEDGLSYTVTVETLPDHHTCTVENGVGVVNSADVADIAIDCTGPGVDIALGASIAWSFDPAVLSYALDATALLQQTTITVTCAECQTIEVNGTGVSGGLPTAPILLLPGANTLGVDLVAGTVSRHYAIGIDRGGKLIEQLHYAKASNTGAGDFFGGTVALSGDTLVVGASGEASGNGNQSDDSATNAGAVYVFRRSGGTWTQEAYLKASNAQGADFFGTSVAISGDLIAVGASGEASNATGPYANQSDNSAAGAGAVYVFSRIGTTWSQEAYIKASNTGAGDAFGQHLALDGDTLAVSAINEDSASTGINGVQSNNSSQDSGAVYVFRKTGVTWAQEAYVKASNTGGGDQFGASVSLGGGTLAVGAIDEDSNATGVGGNQANETAGDAGAAYVFTRSGVTWSQQAYVKASNTDGGDLFGYSVALSGNRLAVGAFGESSGATGVDGDQSDDSVGASGAAYVFLRTGTTWAQEAYVKASNTGFADRFGSSLALVGDVLAVGASGEASNAVGIDGNQGDNTLGLAGAVYAFTWNGSAWSQAAYVKASNTGEFDGFSQGLALSRDGLFVGASGENSSAIGFDGDQANDAMDNAGAVYLFE